MDRKTLDEAHEPPRDRSDVAAGITARTGIDEQVISDLVEQFYGRIREDALLGPIFAERIGEWDAHLARMKAFWASVLLAAGGYMGQPMRVHMPLPVHAGHFDHWLALFEDTARHLMPPEGTDYLMERARRIAQSLELGVAHFNGAMPGPGERFHGAPSGDGAE